jgi:hypothetical protein
MNLRTAWISALLALALTTGAQAADDWKIYRYPQDGFAAEYPIPPAPQEDPPEPARFIRSAQYWSERDNVAFGISATLFLHPVIAGQPPDKTVQNVIEGVRGSMKCTIHSQRAISLPGAVAREVIFDKCPAPIVEVVERVYVAGDRMIQVMVLGSKTGIIDAADTKRFMESFNLIAQ